MRVFFVCLLTCLASAQDIPDADTGGSPVLKMLQINLCSKFHKESQLADEFILNWNWTGDPLL
jgi:hypothetical protein